MVRLLAGYGEADFESLLVQNQLIMDFDLEDYIFMTDLSGNLIIKNEEGNTLFTFGKDGTFMPLVGTNTSIIQDADSSTSITTAATAETIIFKTSSSEVARIDNNGNVGIGTNNPTNLLHLFSDTACGGLYTTTSNPTGCFIGSIVEKLVLSNTDTAGDISMLINGTTVIQVDNNGNVGIGNTNPSEKLEVTGNIKATNIEATLTTAAQPNITSLGTLTSLTVSGALNATLTTAAQPNITSVGTLSSLNVSGALNGTLTTAAQPNITSLGTTLLLEGSQPYLTISNTTEDNCGIQFKDQSAPTSQTFNIDFDALSQNLSISSDTNELMTFENTGLTKINNLHALALEVENNTPEIRITDNRTIITSSNTKLGELSFWSNDTSIGGGGKVGSIVVKSQDTTVLFPDGKMVFETYSDGIKSGDMILDKNGDLDISGGLTVNTTTTLTGDLVVDTNTFFVDSSANSVGIGTIAPTSSLHIKSATTPQLLIDNDSFAQNDMKFQSNRGSTNTISDISWFNTDTTNAEIARIRIQKSDDADGNGEIQFYTANGTTLAQRMTIANDGFVGINHAPVYQVDIGGMTRIVGEVDSSIDGGGLFTQTYFDKCILLNRDNNVYRNFYLGLLGDNTTTANKFCIGIDGSVGANPDPQMSLDEKGRMVLADGLSIGTETETYQLYLSTDSAAKPTSSTWTIASDMRLKENIVDADLDMCYNDIKELPLRKFKWRDNYIVRHEVEDTSNLGFIAQEVELIYPKSVTTMVENDFDLPDVKSVNKDQLIMSLFGAVKKLQNDVEALQSIVNGV